MGKVHDKSALAQLKTKVFVQSSLEFDKYVPKKFVVRPMQGMQRKVNFYFSALLVSRVYNWLCITFYLVISNFLFVVW